MAKPIRMMISPKRINAMMREVRELLTLTRPIWGGRAERLAARPILQQTANLQLKCSPEISEELVGELLGRAVDKSLTQLRKLSTYLCVDLIGQQRAIIPLE
ncbi:hypothetical protein J2R96_005031 [Bradyrhizobium elkanii]|nr:hypothetical protein [Bradyrhizobium elkanii]